MYETLLDYMMYIVYRILTGRKYNLRYQPDLVRRTCQIWTPKKLAVSLGEHILCTAVLLYNVVTRVKKYT